MDLKKILSKRHHKEEMDQIANYAASDPAIFAELWDLVRTGEAPLPQHGSWALSKAADKRPFFVQNHIHEMIAHLFIPNHNSVHRNLARMLSQFEIPEEEQGALYSLCIDWVLDPKKEVAIKVHGMTIAYNIAKAIPELREELALVINDQLEFNSAGFKSRGKKILKQINKQAGKSV